MSAATINMTATVYDYFQKISLREPPVLKKLRAATRPRTGASMQISPEQGQFMALLMVLMGAKKTLDIGTFTGYSALVVALALPQDGKVITCDISAESINFAKQFWLEADVAKKIEARIAPALETLQLLLDNGEAGTFDFAFIDADKNNYAAYYEKALALLRTGGLIAIDNVLWSGKVADPSIEDKATVAIRRFNEQLLQDQRVTLSMLPIGDGLTLAMKR